MVQFNISKNLKKRIFTSSVLLFLLFWMLLNEYILCYSLIVIGSISLLEFFKMSSIIFKRNNNRQLLINTIFSIYIFLFCTLFFLISLLSETKILIYIILLTCVFSDIGGFTFGKIFKGPKLTKISPNKTISGSIGSFMFSALFLFSSASYLLENLNLKFLLIGFIISIGAQGGDLLISLLKRKSFTKDTGNFLPGHGGILDRVDSLLIGIPLGIIILMVMF